MVGARSARKGEATDMRRFEDRHGRLWDVVAGRESWGANYALFVPAGRADDIRQTVLRSASMEDAITELDNMADAALQELLDVSAVKES